MGIIFVILLAVMLIGCAVLVSDEKHVYGTLLTFFALLALKSAIDYFAESRECKQAQEQPTAMDVYQEKTALQVTYVDGVPVDSVVIFKSKVIGNE